MTTEIKVLITGGILTILMVVGAIFLLTKQQTEETSTPQDQIISRQGIHWHPKLTILVKGAEQEIPPNLGIGAVHQPMHTHEDNKEGVIHMETQGVVTKDETRLFKFFQVWGKQFNANCIFDKCNGQDGTVKMLVNNQENQEFENYQMKDGDNIEVKYE